MYIKSILRKQENKINLFIYAIKGQSELGGILIQNQFERLCEKLLIGKWKQADRSNKKEAPSRGLKALMFVVIGGSPILGSKAITSGREAPKAFVYCDCLNFCGESCFTKAFFST